MNNQPMGFYPMETLKQDSRRFGVPFLNPCVNRSIEQCRPEEGSLRLGLRFIRDVGGAAARLLVAERERGGPYLGPGDLARRTGLKAQAMQSLVEAGAFDGVAPHRRLALWDAGLATRPGRAGQAALPLSMGEGTPDLPDFSDFEKMAAEYRVLGIYPKGHLMQFVRPSLSKAVLPTTAVESLEEGTELLVAGWPVARQHPRGQHGTVFVTIEDEDRATCSSLSGRRSSPAAAGSCRAGWSWPRARSPAGTAPPPSLSPTCGASTPASPCLKLMIGAETLDRKRGRSRSRRIDLTASFGPRPGLRCWWPARGT